MQVLINEERFEPCTKSGSYSDTESLNFLQVTNRLISENEKEMKLKDNFFKISVKRRKF